MVVKKMHLGPNKPIQCLKTTTLTPGRPERFSTLCRKAERMTEQLQENFDHEAP